MAKKIYVPAGKTLKDVKGLYTYVGPREVIKHSKLRLEPTFTDGTPWEYMSDTPVKNVKVEEVKEAQKSKTKVESDVISNESLSSNKKTTTSLRAQHSPSERDASKRDED